MELKQTVKLHNKFEITVCDAKTGEEKQKAYAYNVVLDNYFKIRLRQLDGDDEPGYSNGIGCIAVGKGTGTPATTDTALFSALLHRGADLIEEHYEYPTSYITRQMKIEADELNGETLTEVGLDAYYKSGLWRSATYMLCTHAMIQDAEGHTIAINKTDTDVVYITATFYCTFTRSGFGNNGIFPTAATNTIVKYMLKGDISLVLYSGRFAVQDATEVVNDYVFTKSFSFTATGDYENLTLNLPTMTILDTEFNNHLVKNIVLKGMGGFQFPDASAFPDYDINRLALGEGDGTTTEFSIKCPLIKSGTIKIYVADTELAASEYDVDYESNCIDARENYYTASMKVDGTTVKFGDVSSRSAATDYRYLDPLYWGIYPLSGNVYPKYCYVTEANPIWIDFGGAKACNRLRIDQNKISTSYVDSLKIQCSDDNEIWTDLSYTRSEEAYSSSIYYYTFSFAMTTARYWRVFIQNNSWTYYFYYSSSSIGTRDNVSHIKSTFFLGKSVPGLVLHTAPADGEAVEASYKIDIPFKTENNLMRITGSIVMQRG